jgi:hypothetical protein
MIFPRRHKRKIRPSGKYAGKLSWHRIVITAVATALKGSKAGLTPPCPTGKHSPRHSRGSFLPDPGTGKNVPEGFYLKNALRDHRVRVPHTSFCGLECHRIRNPAFAGFHFVYAAQGNRHSSLSGSRCRCGSAIAVGSRWH